MKITNSEIRKEIIELQKKWDSIILKQRFKIFTSEKPDVNHLKEKLSPLGFNFNDGVFENKNLRIYYREDFKEWRIKDISVFSTMDIDSINFPLDEREMAKIWKRCSDHYKDQHEK